MFNGLQLLELLVILFFMKRILMIFLMLYLPLFMQSAWTMSAHMALQNLKALAGLKISHDGVSDSCHHAYEIQDVHEVAHPHHCARCLACVIATSSASFNTAPQFHVPDLMQEISSSRPALYLSIHLPAAIKPPISA